MLNKPETGWKIPPVEAIERMITEINMWSMSNRAQPKRIRMNPIWAAENFPWATTRIEGVQGYKSLLGIPLEWDDAIEGYKIEY